LIGTENSTQREGGCWADMLKTPSVLALSDCDMCDAVCCVFDVSVITGSTKSAVSAAGRRINMIVASARQKQQFTHFLSIPMAGDSIKNNFVAFKVITIYFCVLNSELHVINRVVYILVVEQCTRHYSHSFSFLPCILEIQGLNLICKIRYHASGSRSFHSLSMYMPG
jgi:hypothetical protein